MTEPFELIGPLTALGQIWGLAECWLNEIEPDAALIFEEEFWGSLPDDDQARIDWLFNSLGDYAVAMVRDALAVHGSIDEVLAVPGHFWPKAVYLWSVRAWIEHDTAKAVMKLVTGKEPPAVVKLGGDE